MALWIVATPIGTLDDLSPRAREVLRDAAVIAAEDTRTARKLLGLVGIPAPPIEALHANNEEARAPALAERALTEEVVLVSEAGTPGVSDPGRTLVAEALARGVAIRSVPGPSALAAALAASGFPAAPSTFLGFPPRKGRDGYAREVLGRGETLVFFEAPGRIGDLLSRLASVAPDREAAVCRELSKAFEEVRRGTLRSLASELGEVRGECVLVVGPGKPVRPDVVAVEGTGLKEIADALARRWGVPRRDVYQRLLEWEAELGGGRGRSNDSLA